MATNTREIPAVPEQVWSVLADPEKYSDWVVGAKEVRKWEGNWPAKGSRFHHTVGVWPLRIRDATTVLESERPQRLVLEAKIRPVGFARIAFELSPSERVARAARRLFDPAIFARNSEALRRLENLVCEAAG